MWVMLKPDQVINEYDVVRVHGRRATILIVHDAKPRAYEVEVIDENGDTLEISTVRHDEIESLA